jgi:hypothetical protein
VFLYRLIGLLVYELDRFAQRDDNMLDSTFVQMIRVITRAVVIAIGAIYLLSPGHPQELFRQHHDHAGQTF